MVSAFTEVAQPAFDGAGRVALESDFTLQKAARFFLPRRYVHKTKSQRKSTEVPFVRIILPSEFQFGVEESKRLNHKNSPRARYRLDFGWSLFDKTCRKSNRRRNTEDEPHGSNWVNPGSAGVA